MIREIEELFYTKLNNSLNKTQQIGGNNDIYGNNLISINENIATTNTALTKGLFNNDATTSNTNNGNYFYDK
jgi:hypothetical protein